MMRMTPVRIGEPTMIGIEVKLPKTTLVVVATEKGYIMCGALDVALLNERLKDRGIVAGRPNRFQRAVRVTPEPHCGTTKL